MLDETIAKYGYEILLGVYVCYGMASCYIFWVLTKNAKEKKKELEKLKNPAKNRA